MSEPKISTIKRLFAMSGNACAFPSCQIPIVEESGALTGEICHIQAQNSQGPRYDPDQTEEQRHSFENLILFCRHHHKVVDTEPDIYDVVALKEIKAIHERNVGRPETEKDNFYARILINGLKQINVVNNKGNVMFNSPGAIQGHNVNVRTSKQKLSVNPPPGSIGFDVNLNGYISHLITRYNKFASSETERKTEFNHGAISKNISDTYGADWRLLSIEKASEVIEYLQRRISRTHQARINKGRGWKAFSTYEEYLEKYRK